MVVPVAEKEKGNPIVTVHHKLGRVGLDRTPKTISGTLQGQDGVVRVANRLCDCDFLDPLLLGPLSILPFGRWPGVRVDHLKRHSQFL
jgi:hypothetical protein